MLYILLGTAAFCLLLCLAELLLSLIHISREYTTFRRAKKGLAEISRQSRPRRAGRCAAEKKCAAGLDKFFKCGIVMLCRRAYNRKYKAG